jgi:acetylornithine/N-succinyldiaminopimelate aminotransferase
MDLFAPPPIDFVRGQGVYLFTEDGDRYLDFIAGIAVNSLGHAHPAAVAALTEQANALWHVSNMFRVPGQQELAAKYVEASGLDRVFFTNSGTEAIEAALKTARKYFAAKGEPEKFRIITFEGAFHGRSYAAINAGGNPAYLEGFGPLMDGFDQVPFGDIEAVKAAIRPDTCAVLIEPVQGEGGVRAATTEYLKALRKLCDEHGLLLIYDEVQCGAGRTGRLFAYQWADGGANPDIMALAKGIGAGFPLGACLATEDAARGMTFGAHGTTFGGNPLAMAVGNAVWDILADPAFMEQVNDTANYMGQQLQRLVDAHPDTVEEVRGKGLLIGLKLKASIVNKDVQAICRDNKLLIGVAGGNVVRLAPPLVVSTDEARQAIDVLDRALTEAAQRAKGA